MPNWCMNTVKVFGEDKDIEEFKEFVKDKDLPFSFQKIEPMPEELKNTRSPRLGERDKVLTDKYGADNWYDWSIINWGVKWDNSDVQFDQEDSGSIRYNFDTPWGPPEGIYNILNDKFPDLSISWFYDEPGMQVAGYLPSY